MRKLFVSLLLAAQFIAMSYVGLLAWSAVSWRAGEDWASVGAALIGMPLAGVQFVVMGIVFAATSPSSRRGSNLRRISLAIAIVTLVAAVIGSVDP